MSLSYRAKNVICPFYKADTVVTISCEGPFDACVRIQMLFENKRGNELHFRAYCCQAYHYCEVYRMIYKTKYEDERG